MKNKHYWSYNLPLQVWPVHEVMGDDSSPVIGASILNYMPRKEAVCECQLSDLLGDQTREEFFETAALHFENLARLFREAAKDPNMTIYYHDEGMQEAKQ